ncbi:MAG: sterol carrier [Alphaproteobacteria bacterium]|nr:MAG: sterol carrier [Alphaproteobacteria bacterium]
MNADVDALTRAIEERLGDFAGLDARILFDLDTGGCIGIDATAHPPSLAPDMTADDADCTIRVSADNLRKLIDGSLNPMLAYTLGKLKIDGSMGLAMKIAARLEE